MTTDEILAAKAAALRSAATLLEHVSQTARWQNLGSTDAMLDREFNRGVEHAGHLVHAMAVALEAQITKEPSK